MINLYSYIVNYTTGGTWTNILYPSTAPTISGGNVDFTSLPKGEYVFRYRVISSSCTSDTLVTITKFGITLTNTSTTCTKTLSLYNSNNEVNKLDVYTKPDSKYIFASVTELIDSSCNASISKTFNNEATGEEGTRGKIYYTHTFPAVTGTYVKNLKVTDNVSNVAVNLNLNPTTTPYLNPALPCTTPVVQADLYFGQLGYATQLRNLIKNAMCVLYGATTDNYDVIVTTGSSDIKIKIGCKNNPSGLWVGIQSSLATPNTDTAVYNDTTTDHTTYPTFEILPVSLAILEDVSCAVGLTTQPYVNFTIDTVNSNYLNIILTAYSFNISGNLLGSPVLTTNCNNYILKVTANTNCPTQTITWLRNGVGHNEQNVDTLTVLESQTGVYTAVVDCEGCSKTESVTIT